MYWRRFRISDIPVDNDAAFAMWLKNRWTEKDYLLEHFFRHGSFPEGDPVKAMQTEAALQKVADANSKDGKKTVITPVTKTAKFISTEVKSGGWEEFLSIFGPITAAATALSSGELAPGNIDFDALLGKVAQQQQMNLLKTGAAPKGPRSQDDIRRALEAAVKAGGQPIGALAIESITRKAAQTQREMLQAMSKKELPPLDKSPTAGKHLDPSVQRVIEDAHEETRQRLLRASQPTSRQAKPSPNVRKSVPMTPMETLVTRPLSTIAMQRARQKMQNAAANRRSQGPSASTASKQAADLSKRQGASKPASIKKDNAQSTASGNNVSAATKAKVNNGKASSGTGQGKQGFGAKK